MNILSNYLNFIPGVNANAEQTGDDLFFIFHKNKILINENEGRISFTKLSEVKYLNDSLSYETYLGSYIGINCYCGELGTEVVLHEHQVFKDLRSLLTVFDEELFMVCGKAAQIIDWNKNHRYCGNCGSETLDKGGERAKQCKKCGQLFYPRISPAIIVAVTKEDKILLAHNKNFKNDMFSVVAGFVEPGENFEQCVMREVMEETGIKVKNIKYFASQPWPFPNSLMVAFTAEYEGGQVTPDGVEIDQADWFSYHSMPSVPGKGSVAGKLIHWYLNKYKF